MAMLCGHVDDMSPMVLASPSPETRALLLVPHCERALARRRPWRRALPDRQNRSRAAPASRSGDARVVDVRPAASSAAVGRRSEQSTSSPLRTAARCADAELCPRALWTGRTRRVPDRSLVRERSGLQLPPAPASAAGPGASSRLASAPAILE